jgi:hypothetical protein
MPIVTGKKLRTSTRSVEGAKSTVEREFEERGKMTRRNRGER